MGTSTDAILAFGINLDEDLPEKFRAAVMDPDNEFPEFSRLICREAGIEELAEGSSEEAVDAHYQRVREAEDKYPLALISHCSYEYPLYVLAVARTETRARRGSPQEINPSTLAVTDEQIKALREFCERYDIEYTEPTWLLFSNWS